MLTYFYGNCDTSTMAQTTDELKILTGSILEERTRCL